MTTTRAARRLVRHALLATLALAWSALDAARLPAQGVTSAAVSGRVTDTTGTPLGAVQIEVVNRATGFVSLTQTRRDGRYFVAGLEVGGPYSVIARRIGYQRQVRDGQTVSLSQDLVVDFRLSPQPVQLGLVTVTPEASPVLSAERTGPATLVSDSLLRRLPTLGRNFTDFLMLVPQVSDAGPGLSAAGANNRYNNIQIDGASENDLFGLGATGQPGG
ncbi:MAG TPA: carboxypeptidase-like regulatory domain-containing protein, partial [Gemmatimonadales bacterium]|nr:carboxypeptidase-like regulatory domain-containing protein [Gemmatimonadales bacterium]